jgi:hypothetical protein
VVAAIASHNTTISAAANPLFLRISKPLMAVAAWLVWRRAGWRAARFPWF